jgi:hypothetical protein
LLEELEHPVRAFANLKGLSCFLGETKPDGNFDQLDRDFNPIAGLSKFEKNKQANRRPKMKRC